MRARTGFNRANAFFRQHALGLQEPRVFVRVDVVGNDTNGELVAEMSANRDDHRAFASADRAGYAEPQGAADLLCLFSSFNSHSPSCQIIHGEPSVFNPCVNRRRNARRAGAAAEMATPGPAKGVSTSSG